MANEELMAEIEADMCDIERQEQAIFEKWILPEQERKLREEARENMFWSGDEYVREESDTTDFLIEGFLPYTLESRRDPCYYQRSLDRRPFP